MRQKLSSRSGARIGVTAALVVASLLMGCADGDDEEADSADLVQKGIEAQAKGDLEGAEAAYADAVEADATNVYGYYNLGVVEQATNRTVDAEDHYRQALTIDPSLAPALFNLAILRTQAGAIDEAISLYQRVTTQRTDDAGAHFNLGLLLQRQHRTDEAEIALARARQLDPGLLDRVISTAP